MTQQEADAEAKRLWGPKARAQPYLLKEGYFEIVQDIAALVGWLPKWGPLTQVIGFGRSYEEAIENGKNNQYLIAQVPKAEPEQLQLF